MIAIRIMTFWVGFRWTKKQLAIEQDFNEVPGIFMKEKSSHPESVEFVLFYWIQDDEPIYILLYFDVLFIRNCIRGRAI